MNLKVGMRRISEFSRKQKVSQDYENGLQPLDISRADMRRWFEKMKSQFHIIIHCKRDDLEIKFRNVIVSRLYFSSMNSSTGIPKCLPDEDLV
jgi:hypothetical protein